MKISAIRKLFLLENITSALEAHEITPRMFELVEKYLKNKSKNEKILILDFIDNLHETYLEEMFIYFEKGFKQGLALGYETTAK